MKVKKKKFVHFGDAKKTCVIDEYAKTITVSYVFYSYKLMKEDGFYDDTIGIGGVAYLAAPLTIAATISVVENALRLQICSVSVTQEDARLLGLQWYFPQWFPLQERIANECEQLQEVFKAEKERLIALKPRDAKHAWPLEPTDKRLVNSYLGDAVYSNRLAELARVMPESDFSPEQQNFYLTTIQEAYRDNQQLCPAIIAARQTSELSAEHKSRTPLSPTSHLSSSSSSQTTSQAISEQIQVKPETKRTYEGLSLVFEVAEQKHDQISLEPIELQTLGAHENEVLEAELPTDEPLLLSAAQNAQIELGRRLFNVKLTQVFATALAIKHGRVDGRNQNRVSLLISLISAFLPFPGLGLALHGAVVVGELAVTQGAQKAVEKFDSKKYGKPLDGIETIDEAADHVSALVEALTRRFQLVLAQLRPDSLEIFVDKVVDRMIDYWELVADTFKTQEDRIRWLSQGLIDITRPVIDISGSGIDVVCYYGYDYV